MLISPRATLISCGSSSRLYRRRNRPTAVCRGITVRLVGLRRRSWITSRRSTSTIGLHRPELQHLERHTVATDTTLPEQDRTAHRDGDHDRADRGHRNRGDDESEHRGDSIEGRLARSRCTSVRRNRTSGSAPLADRPNRPDLGIGRRCSAHRAPPMLHERCSCSLFRHFMPVSISPSGIRQVLPST